MAAAMACAVRGRPAGPPGRAHPAAASTPRRPPRPKGWRSLYDDRRPSTDAHAEARAAHARPSRAAARAAALLDQLGLWGNLGVSLLGFTGALYVLYPLERRALSLGAALTALVRRHGARHRRRSPWRRSPAPRPAQPAMVLLRGLFGARLSCAADRAEHRQLRRLDDLRAGRSSARRCTRSPCGRRAGCYVLVGGVITTVLALRPLGWIRLLRRYVTVVVVRRAACFFVQLLRDPLPRLGPRHAGSGFWIAVDTVIAVSVSWVPVAADYTRHSRQRAPGRHRHVRRLLGHPDRLLRARPARAARPWRRAATTARCSARSSRCRSARLAFAVLAVRELDQSFVDTYSTAVSVQNLRPRWDRRVLAARRRHAGHAGRAGARHRATTRTS